MEGGALVTTRHSSVYSVLSSSDFSGEVVAEAVDAREAHDGLCQPIPSCAVELDRGRLVLHATGPGLAKLDTRLNCGELERSAGATVKTSGPRRLGDVVRGEWRTSGPWPAGEASRTRTGSTGRQPPSCADGLGR
mmetsp:Transcript_89573/g.240206  ORF Transcript_89573/g.240206 Transcript_89573/m.240206 type:complete len:135 (-) Transcript_89573:48-452(-)